MMSGCRVGGECAGGDAVRRRWMFGQREIAGVGGLSSTTVSGLMRWVRKERLSQ